MEDWKMKKALKAISVNGTISKEKQIELFKQFHQDLANGIAPEDSMARTMLIVANEQLINRVANDLICGYFNFNSDSIIYSDAKIWLIKAVDTFNVDLNTSFSTYAYPLIKTGILRYFQEQKRFAKRMPVEIQLSTMHMGPDEDSREFEIADDYSLSEDIITKLDCETKRKQLVKFFKYLTENEQDVLINYFGLFGKKPIAGYRYAKITSISHQTARNRLTAALQKLSLLLKTKTLTQEEKEQLFKIKKKTFSYIPEIQNFVDENNYDVVSL